jgi:DNA modification methylase
MKVQYNDCSARCYLLGDGKMQKMISRNIHPKNELNMLPGNRWLYFTRSVIRTDLKKNVGFELREAHGSNKPPELMKEFIEFFTKNGGMVLDPFAGVGGTLLGASMCSRKAVGIEVNKKWVSIYKKVCKKEKLAEHPIYVGDCLEIMERLRERWRGFFDLILTDPPYGPRVDKTMCNGKYPNSNRISSYNSFSASEKDFSNTRSLGEYFQRMQEFFAGAATVLKGNRYLVLITKNCYRNGRYIFMGARLAEIANKENFTLKGEIVWEQKGTRLRPYGYPFVFVPNIIHHNILIFRKEVHE